MDTKENPKIFISYSWANSSKVLELAERLMSNGVEVVLDKWDLKEGQDKYAFMEQSVNDPTINKVLIICDKAYTEKANQREGGVGDETVIISQEVYGKVEQEKFIPVIFELDSNGKPYCPTYIKTRIYIDLSSENEYYESNYEQLLRNLHRKPLHRKPALGKTPEWLEEEQIDLSAVRSLTKQLKNCSGDERKFNILASRFVDEFIEILKNYKLPGSGDVSDILLRKIEESKPLRDLYTDFIDSLICSDFDMAQVISDFFEQAFNNTYEAEGNSCSVNEFEFFKFFFWETFICTAATLLHHKLFKELNQIITHTYFLRQSALDPTPVATSFIAFRHYSKLIEHVCKPKCDYPNLHTLAGDILVKREKKPTLTKISLANADTVLYQLSRILELTNDEQWYWFPMLYCYHQGAQTIWIKLESKKYCQSILPLFGFSAVDELKKKIAERTPDEKVRHGTSFDYAPVISDSIKVEKIATQV